MNTTTTKNALSAPSALSAPTLSHPDMRFLREECGEDFLRDFISARFGFSAVHDAPEMWEGEDGCETGEYFADIESAFDAAELFQQRGKARLWLLRLRGDGYVDL